MTTECTTGRPGFDPRQRQRFFSSSLCVQTNSQTHPASYLKRTGGPFSGPKREQGVRLTAPPHQCQGQEWVVAIYPSPPCLLLDGSVTPYIHIYIQTLIHRERNTWVIYSSMNRHDGGGSTHLHIHTHRRENLKFHFSQIYGPCSIWIALYNL
jgi:hypothetical protein